MVARGAAGPLGALPRGAAQPADRLAADDQAVARAQQLPAVLVVTVGVDGLGAVQDLGPHRLGQPAGGGLAAVAMQQGRRAPRGDGRREAFDLPTAQVHALSRLHARELAGQDQLEDVPPGERLRSHGDPFISRHGDIFM